MTTLATVLLAWMRRESIVLIQGGKSLSDEEERRALEEIVALCKDVLSPSERPTIEMPVLLLEHHRLASAVTNG